MRVLIVEDEPNLGRQLRSTLEGAGYAVDLATDGEDGHYLGSTENYDAVILDLGLPEVDGLTVLDRWRKEARKMPVLVLTARDSWSDKVAGLDAGADDYLAKPFQTEELIARLRALIRRSSGNASSELNAGDIRLDTRSGKVTKGGEPEKLTAQEYKLLSYLMHHKGKVVSRTELIEHIYDQDFDRDSNTIEVFVTRIRKKLGPDVITTIRGLGYSLEEPEEKRGGTSPPPAAPAAAADQAVAVRKRARRARTGSLTRRIIGVAALWVTALLLIGGFALDRVLSRSIVDNFDNQLVLLLNKPLIAASEISPGGEVRFNRPPADQRFIEPYSGLYFQVSGAGADTFASRSLWDRRLRVSNLHNDVKPHLYDSSEFGPGEPIRVAERDAILPG